MEEGNEFSGELAQARAQHKDSFEVDGKKYPVKENGLQRYTGIKKYGKEGFEALQKAGREGAGEEEKGRIKDRYIKKEDVAIDETSQTYRDAMATQRSAGIQGRADDAEGRMAQRAAQPKTLGQKIKKDIGEPLAKLAKGDIKGALGEEHGMEEGVDHTAVASNLAKLARVIKSVQTPEQFAVAQKYARRMNGTIMKHQHDNMGFGSGLRANLGVMRAVDADLKAKAAELGIEFVPLAEGFPTVADAKKQAEKERGTGKFDKKSISTGTVYSRKYDAKSGESADDGKDGEGKAVEKRGRGRPKKSTFESHKTINRMIDDVFEDIMGEGDEQQLSYEQEQLKSHIGAHMYKQLENTMKTGDDFSDNLFDVLYGYYMDEMPYGVAKARTGDPTQWLHDKVQGMFPALDEGRIEGGVWVDKPGNVPAPMDPEGVPSKPMPASTGRATIAPADANKFMQSSDPQIFNKLTGTKAVGKPTIAVSDPEGVKEDDMEEGNLFTKGLANDSIKVGEKIPGTSAVKTKDIDEALNQMRRIAGLPVLESKADEKADDDYDNDGKVETGKDEYLGSKIRAAKKAGKLEEGEMCTKCDCDPCECDKEKVDECMSPMGNGMDEEGKMNINTSMDSDGHKSVTITADGNSALELMQMLKLAGMGGGNMPQEEPGAVVAVSEPEEVGTGDAGEPEGVMVVATDGDQDVDQGFGDEEEVDEDARYEANATPEEHVYPTQKLTKGGDGDFGEKKMHGDKPTWKNGDNPMSESISLKMMKEYEGIKIKK